MNKWVIGAVGSVLGFLASQWIGMYEFSRNLTATKEIETIHLAREMTAEFFAEKDGDSLYKDVRTKIESCRPVYKPNGGQFDHDQVNRYLGFFDDLGFYYRRHALDEDIIDQIFGAYVVEASEYDELKKYVVDVQRNSNESTAFTEFQALAKELLKKPDRAALASTFVASCRVAQRGAPR